MRRPVRIDEVEQIGAQPIYIGKDGSGSFETARVILGAGGRSTDQLNLFTGSAEEALQAMGRGQLLAMLRTTGRGHADIGSVLDSGLAALNPLPEDVLNRLIDGYPYYRVCPIEPRHYPGRLEYSLPTVCVSAVLLSAVPRAQAEDARLRATGDAIVGTMLDSLERVARDPTNHALGLELLYRDFAEKEPIPLHPMAARRESWALWMGWLELLAGVLAVGLLGFFARRALHRRGIATGFAFEGQLSNPLVPFAAFAVVVVLSTYLVWFLEHDSNTRLRTLNDSFWEMNTFATGNFSTDTLKTSGARLVGAMATILGLGLLAWFTAALTNIFAQDQTRLWRRLHQHFVVLNFREDMLPLIRLLRSPGPARLRALHVVVPDALPKRVRLQLARIKALTIHYDNPEVPENLATLRLPRAARVIVLGGEADPRQTTSYDPLRIARAVHQACARDPQNRAAQGRAGLLALRTMSVASTSGAASRAALALPVTLVETSESEPDEIFDPFAAWLVPVDSRQLGFPGQIRRDLAHPPAELVELVGRRRLHLAGPKRLSRDVVLHQRDVQAALEQPLDVLTRALGRLDRQLHRAAVGLEVGRQREAQQVIVAGLAAGAEAHRVGVGQRGARDQAQRQHQAGLQDMSHEPCPVSTRRPTASASGWAGPGLTSMPGSPARARPSTVTG